VTDTQRLTSQRWRWVTVTFRVAEGAHGLEAVPGVKSLTTNESGAVRLRVEGSVDPLLKALAKLSVDDVQIERPSLEEIFLSYYEGEGSP
jgi:ABC-2 type transport system ATP-binding protein